MKLPKEGQIVILAKEKYSQRPKEVHPSLAEFIPFSAEHRMSGINLHENGSMRQIRKGAADAIEKFISADSGSFPFELKQHVEKIALEGGTPLVVSESNKALGVIKLKDIVKGG